jgi:hypothetical protein
MSRSNVPANQPGGWPPAAQPQQGYAGQDTTGRPAQRPPAQGAPHPQSPYAQQPPPQAPGYPAFPEPQSPYADPNAFRGPSPYAQQPQQRAPYPGEATPPTAGRPAQPGASAGQAPSYLPQFDPYVPPSQPSPYAQAQAFGQPQLPQAAPAFGQQQPHAAPQAFGQPSQPTPSFPPPAAYDSQRAPPQFGQRAPAPNALPPQQPQPFPESGLSQLAALRAPSAQQRPAEPAFQPAAPSFPQPSAFQQPAAFQQQQPAAQPDAWRQPLGAPAAKPQPAAHGFDHGDFLQQPRPDETTAGRRAGQQSGDLNFGEWPRPAPSFAQHGPGQHQQQPGFGQEPHFDGTDGLSDGYDQQAGEYEQGQDGEDDEQYDYDEPKKRSSIFMVAGALVAAVVVGSGLAFVYQKFGPAPGTQTAAVIKSDGAPAKVKPAEPGGKQFANSDSKVMGRLTENGVPITTSSTGAGSGDTDPGAPRKVSTIAVGRDGSLAAPAPASAEPPAAAPAQPTVAVPGLTIVDGFGGRQPPPRPVTATVSAPVAAAPPQQPVVVTPPPVATVKPVVTAKAAVPAATDAIDADVGLGAPEAAAAPAPKKPAVAKKKVVDAYGAAASTVTAAGTPAASPAPAVTSTGGNGYIPVLASVPMSAKSRMDALKQFADMQQKYASVLGDKTPDVQEANLGEKGTYHRLLAGPPGSREQASQICSQLKAAGYAGCWVTAY